MIEELGRHGYKLSPGTLYAMRHAMEKNGYLVSHGDSGGPGGRRRRRYRVTGHGREALALARQRLRELVGEVSKDD